MNVIRFSLMPIICRVFFAIFFMVCMAVPMASAQTQGVMTAIRLQQLCDSRYDVDVGMCAGYVMAVAEQILQDPRPSRRVCLSPAIGPEVLIQNLRRAWQDTPPAAYDLAIENVEMTLRHRFKCL